METKICDLLRKKVKFLYLFLTVQGPPLSKHAQNKFFHTNKKLLFIKHAYSHLYATNNDTFLLFYIHLLMHIQVHLKMLQKHPQNTLYGQPHPFEPHPILTLTWRSCGEKEQPRKIARSDQHASGHGQKYHCVFL